MSVGYDPVGRCIYCGTTQPPLYREHIVPFGLEGTGALPEASCGPCGEITGGLEGVVLGKMLGPFRHAANFRSRKRKRKPQDRPLKIYEGEEEKEIPLGRSEYPIALNLPVFPVARLLRGLPPDNFGETIEDGGWWHWIDTQRVEKLSAERGINSFHVGTMEPLSYARLMAKIAHGATVAELGVDGFTPLTVDLILGRSGAMNYWVGCGGFDNRPNPEDVLHASIRRDHSSGMIVQIVQLFATIDAPAYHVVTGVKPGGNVAQTR